MSEGQSCDAIQELVIPKKEGVGTSDERTLLHFYAFKYPINEESEARRPIRVAGRTVVYIDNVVKDGENQLAVTHTTGVQIINPITGKSENYALPRNMVEEQKHCNGCCTIDDVVSSERDVVVASCNGKGLFKGRITGTDGNRNKTGVLEPAICASDFTGYVRAHKNRLYYISGTEVIGAELAKGRLLPVERYSFDHPDMWHAKLNNFTIFDELPPESPERKLRVFATADRRGSEWRGSPMQMSALFESKGDECSVVYAVPRSMLRAGPDLRHVSVERIFGDNHIICSCSDHLALIKLDDPRITRTVPIPYGNIMSFNVAESADELAIVAGVDRSTRHPTMFFYHKTFSGDATAETLARQEKPVWTEGYIINDTGCYSELRNAERTE
jgi:hypothetical protein